MTVNKLHLVTRRIILAMLLPACGASVSALDDSSEPDAGEVATLPDAMATRDDGGDQSSHQSDSASGLDVGNDTASNAAPDAENGDDDDDDDDDADVDDGATDRADASDALDGNFADADLPDAPNTDDGGGAPVADADAPQADAAVDASRGNDASAGDAGPDAATSDGGSDSGSTVDAGPPNTCPVAPATWCSRVGADCGEVACGSFDPVECGACPANKGTCGGGGSDHVCGSCESLGAAAACGGETYWSCPFGSVTSSWMAIHCSSLGGGAFCCPVGP